MDHGHQAQHPKWSSASMLSHHADCISMTGNTHLRGLETDTNHWLKSMTTSWAVASLWPPEPERVTPRLTGPFAMLCRLPDAGLLGESCRLCCSRSLTVACVFPADASQLPWPCGTSEPTLSLRTCMIAVWIGEETAVHCQNAARDHHGRFAPCSHACTLCVISGKGHATCRMPQDAKAFIA